MLTAASEASGYDIKRVEVIASNQYSPVRLRDDYNGKVELAGTIQRVAIDFCGADAETSMGAIKASVDMMRSKFGRIAIPEIKEAFEMASVGHLGEINIIAYKGVFTAGIFGEVMAAYAKARDRIIWELGRMSDKEAQEARDKEIEERQEQCKADVISEFESLREKNTRFEKCERIPVHWAKILTDAGLICSDPKMWIEAKSAIAAKFKADTQAIKELRVLNVQQADKLESMAFPLAERNLIVQEMFENPDILPDALYVPASQLYGRMLIFKNIAPYEVTQPRLFE